MDSFSAILAASLLLSGPAERQILPDLGKDPTVNLSAIRWIDCGKYMGTGFMVAKDTLATALHIADGKCVDLATKSPATVYHRDEARDFALMRLKIDVGPYIKYSCNRFKTGNTYSSYGWSSYLQDRTIFRQSKMKALFDYQKFSIKGKSYNYMRHLYGPMVYGHSGGPIIDDDGYARGMNNVGDTILFGLFVTGHSYSTELADTILCKR